jgi:hypothetical protein
VRQGETRISGSKRRILGYRLLEHGDALAVATQPKPASSTDSACAKVQIVRFRTGLIPPAAAPELQPQAVDDTAGNLVLDGEDVRKLAVIPSRPQRKVVARPNQLHGDP